MRGHGENCNSFLESRSGNGLREDVKNAVEYLRQSSRVDGSRIVVMIIVGLGLATIPFVLGLVLRLFVVLSVMFEVFAASVYRVSGNLLMIAIVETLWFARTAALSWPITFKF